MPIQADASAPGVGVHHVHEHDQAQAVRLVNHRLQLVRRAAPAAGLQFVSGGPRCCSLTTSSRSAWAAGLLQARSLHGICTCQLLLMQMIPKDDHVKNLQGQSMGCAPRRSWSRGTQTTCTQPAKPQRWTSATQPAVDSCTAAVCLRACLCLKVSLEHCCCTLTRSRRAPAPP